MTKKIIIILAVLVIGGGLWWLTQPQSDATPAETPAAVNSSATSTIPTSPLTSAAVAQHGSAASCWTIIGGKVYDLTPWINQHPGGSKAILGTCGLDATAAFTRQHGSNAQAQAALANFLIGDLSQ